MTFNSHQIKNYIKHAALAKRKGHGVHSPFAFKLCEEVFYNPNSFYDFETLNQIRKQLLLTQTELEIEDYGAGSKALNNKKRKISDIAGKGISTKKQSQILYKLLNFLQCQTIIELGTSLGLNTLYLAQANKRSKVFSIEGSKKLFEFAQQLAKKNNVTSVEFIHAKFDEVLPSLLSQINTLDCFYVDGNHTYEATLSYFNLALTKKKNSSVFIFDDIYWSPGMTKAWQEIKQHPEVRLAIDTFYFGLIFFKEEIKEKVDLRFWV